jgi:hypothetical protein
MNDRPAPGGVTSRKPALRNAEDEPMYVYSRAQGTDRIALDDFGAFRMSIGNSRLQQSKR